MFTSSVAWNQPFMGDILRLKRCKFAISHKRQTSFPFGLKLIIADVNVALPLFCPILYP